VRGQRRPGPLAHADRARKHDLLWGSVEIYQVDERVTPDGDPERNLTHVRQILGSLPVTLLARKTEG
jgi:6-phosphogluconolactonase